MRSSVVVERYMYTQCNNTCKFPYTYNLNLKKTLECCIYVSKRTLITFEKNKILSSEIF